MHFGKPGWKSFFPIIYDKEKDMEFIAIKGKVRSDIGTKAAKSIRHNNEVPCVIYGGDEAIHFTAPVLDFKKLIYTNDFKRVEIEVDGKTYKCILKDMQFHPVTDRLMHLDFLELVAGKTIKVELPVRFKGTAPGVKTGGKLFQKLRTVKVKTTPENLVDELLADISTLNLGQSIRVRDIELGKGMEMLSSPGIPVASVEVPRALRSADSKAAEEGTTGAAPAAAGKAGAEGGGEAGKAE